jgi:Cys-tRNA(Pro) deacylase
MGNELSSKTLERSMPPLLPLEAQAPASGRHPALDTIASWARSYLCCPHADLGRSGPMCPFVPGALQKHLLFAAVHEQDELDVGEIKAILHKEMERFIKLDPVSGNEAQFKSLMVIFPGLPADEVEQLIESAQADLQKDFVPNGLMVGEFHAGPPAKGGLWNSQFRPLYSPVPMLVIRHMVPTDLLFLKDSPELFREYTKIYGNAVPERFRTHFEEAAKRFGMTTNPDEETRQAAPRVLAALDAAGLDYHVHCHDDYAEPIRVPRDFADALGYVEGRITKSLLLRSRDRDHHVMLICGMDKRVDLRGVAALLDTGRLEMAPLADLQRLVGYPPTSVTPIAVEHVPVFIDEALMQFDTVLTGSGVPRVEIEIAPDDLRALCHAKAVAMA